MNNVKKIGWKEKSAYFLTNVGNIPIMTLVNSYLLVFYVDIVGLDPAAVGTLFLISRVLDGFSDPIMGYVIDHLPQTKLGRFRPYIIIGAIVCTLNFLLLWFGPLLFPSFQLLIVYVSYLLIGITFDLMDIPLNSILPVMTDDLEERNKLSSLKGVAYIIGGTAIGIVAPLILAASATLLDGYVIIIISASLIVLIFSIVGALGIKERIKPISGEKYKLKDLLPILTARPVVVTFFTQLFTAISNSVASASGMFFVLYVLDNRPDVLSMVGLLSLVGSFIGVLAIGFITKKIDKKVIYSSGLIVSALFNLLRLVDVTNIPLLYICTLFAAAGGGVVMSLQYGIQADNVDYIELKYNERAEGALASTNSFLTKAGSGIGGALPGYVLAMVGYAPNVQQTGLAINGIVFLTIILPAIFVIIAALLFGFGYNLNKEEIKNILVQLKIMRSKKTVVNEQI